MKTDVIKEALESVKKEDPKLYEDVVEYISSNKNKILDCISRLKDSIFAR